MSTIPAVVPVFDEQVRGSRSRAWAVTAMVVILMMINFGDKAVLGLAAAPIMKELHLNKTEFGAISSSFFFLFSISGLLVGFVSNRVSTRRILGTIAILWSVATVPILLVASLPMLYASRIALGAAEGPTASMAVHSVQKWFPERSRAVPTALTQMGGGLGLAITAPTLTYFIVHYGWRAGFLALAVSGLVWVAAWYFIGKEGPYTTYAAGSEAAVAETTEHKVSYLRLFLSRTWLGGLVAGLGAYWTLSASTAWLPNLLEESRGYSKSDAGFLVSLPPLLSVVVMLFVSMFAERLVRKGLSARIGFGVTSGALLALSGVAAIFAAHSTGTVMLVLVTIACGLPSAFYPLNYVMLSRMSPVKQRGAVLAASTAGFTFAGVISQTISGKIMDAAGKNHDAAFSNFFLTAAAIMIVGGVVGILTLHPDADARRFGLRQ
jgi:MFS family permease